MATKDFGQMIDDDSITATRDGKITTYDILLYDVDGNFLGGAHSSDFYALLQTNEIIRIYNLFEKYGLSGGSQLKFEGFDIDGNPIEKEIAALGTMLTFDGSPDSDYKIGTITVSDVVFYPPITITLQ